MPAAVRSRRRVPRQRRAGSLVLLPLLSLAAVLLHCGPAWLAASFPSATRWPPARGRDATAAAAAGFVAPHRGGASAVSASALAPAASKQISLGQVGQEKLAAGINAVADAVKVTLGPTGRNVVLQRGSFQPPQIVNDGVTIMRAISLADPEADLGAKLLTQASTKSESNAGDGTTSTAILTQEMVRQGMQLVASGYNPILMNKGMKVAAEAIAAEIIALAKPIEVDGPDLVNIATVSTSGDAAMGRMLAEAFRGIGKKGNVIIEESQVIGDEVEITEGITVDRGFLSPYFITDEGRGVVELRRPRVLVTDQRLSDVYDLVKLLEPLLKEKAPLFIIADDVAAEVLLTLVLNKQRGILEIAAVRAPSFGARRTATLQDIAIATGATFISSELGMTVADATTQQLGSCERVVVEKDKAVIMTDGSHVDDVKRRIEQLEDLVDSTTSTFERQGLQERIASLAGGIARIKVGGATETEVGDKKLRYTDGMNSVRSALEMGIVPGGGSTLLWLAREEFRKQVREPLESADEQMGAEVVFRSLEAPMRQIAKNAGVDASEVVFKSKGHGFGYGYNVLQKTHQDLMQGGIVDSANVVINTVTSAASIAGMVLTTDAVVSDIPEPPAAQRGGMEGMGGMGGGFM
eukprot:NODE_1652_length_2409_cov_8.007450.p1 GENE.NODE_1652_length_2409_cov_8.007450~~NODE_1652_length_2409_cov_8.007450.p1  ORF type:complete len:662 (+),score=237.12 NODE_1652_length_2409_cov_8.007450:78-1988(+)